MGVRVLEDYGEWGTPVMRDAGAGGGLDLRAHRVKKRWAASGGEHKEDTVHPGPTQGTQSWENKELAVVRTPGSGVSRAGAGFWESDERK